MGAEFHDDGRLLCWTPQAADMGRHEFRLVEGDTARTVLVEVRPLRAALFVFAHSDDEFGIVARIDRVHREGVAAHGVWSIVSGRGARGAESNAAWDELGIPAEHRHFLGGSVKSVKGLVAIYDAMVDLARKHPFDEIYLPAYEGGHVDHDLTHVAAARAIEFVAFKGQVYEFGLYNFHNFPLPLLLRPFPASTPTVEMSLSRGEYLRLEGLVELYPSQRHVTTGFLLGLSEDRKRSPQYRLLPRWDYTRPPYSGRPLWYEVNVKRGKPFRFERDVLPLIRGVLLDTRAPPPTGRHEQDIADRT